MYPLPSLKKRNPEELSPLLKFLNLSHSDILDHFPEGVFLVNTRWQVVYFNHMAEEITGFSREEVMGKFCYDVFLSDLCQKDCPMRISMSTGEILVDREVEITTKGGQKILHPGQYGADQEIGQCGAGRGGDLPLFDLSGTGGGKAGDAAFCRYRGGKPPDAGDYPQLAGDRRLRI